VKEPHVCRSGKKPKVFASANVKNPKAGGGRKGLTYVKQCIFFSSLPSHFFVSFFKPKDGGQENVRPFIAENNRNAGC
jgi:hypothetical protein